MSETWGPPQFQGKRSRSEKAIFGALGDFQGILGAALSHRAALKGTNPRGRTPICGFLRVPAVSCGFLRKSAVFCENLRFPNALFSRKRRESAKISENLRLGSVVPLGLSP